MKSLNTKLAFSVVGVALLTTAAYAQTPDRHIYHTGTVRAHAIHTGTARAAAIYDQAAPNSSYYASNDVAAFGSSQQPLYDAAVPPEGGQPLYDAAVSPEGGQPLYDAAVSPEGDQSLYNAAVPAGNDLYDVVCLGGRGVGRYPNAIASGQSAATMESGGDFFLDRGYRGCFAYPGD
jgi:hypothetical protein